MRKIALIGRSGAGKTTLTQALKGEKIQYHKTQYVNHFDVVIDTPGEYAQTTTLARALALYSYEADVVGFLIAATEPYSLFAPNITGMVNRDVIGIVTQIHDERANIQRAGRWLALAGCKTLFYVDSKTGEGVPQILEYLSEEGDELPWQSQMKNNKNNKIESKNNKSSTKNKKKQHKSIDDSVEL
ncbi:MAG: EutP/PduV family microcompartment system protein [Lachnospiraceae bacterium]